MKKSVLLSVCLLAASFALAQSYLPMAVENAHWIMFSLSDDGPYHHVFSIKGDTVINGQAYKKTWWHRIQSSVTHPADLTPPYFIENAELIGSIRDDATAEKTYYIPFTPLSDSCGLFQEVLLHDFSAQAGDIVGGCLHYYPNFPIEVSSVSTEFLWGEERKVINVDFCAGMITGLGTGLGPFWSLSFCPNVGNPTDLVDYCVGDDSECGIQMVSNTRQRLSDWQIMLSPNPVADVLTIELPEGQQENLQLSILDYTGKIVTQQQCNGNSKSVKINVGHLANGVYLLTIGNENGIAARRFAKQ